MTEEFAYGQSFIHQLDPVIRILAALILSVSAALSDHLYLVWAYWGIAVTLVAAARLNFKRVLIRLKPVLFFLIAVWILLPLTFDKTQAVMLWKIDLSVRGIELSAKISVKAISILLIFISLISTMTVSALGNGLHRLRIPDKMVFLLLMAYRYIGVIENEYFRLRRAAKLRGFRPGTNLHSYRTFSYLAGMLFVRASIRANRVYQAMLCRGFNQKFHTLDIYPKTPANSAFLVLMGLLAVVLVVVEHV